MHSLRSAFCCLALLVLVSASHAQAPAAATVNCKGPFKALLESSHTDRRGVTLFIAGQSLSGIVTACHDDGRVELSSQQYSRIVVLADRIDAAAM